MANLHITEFQFIGKDAIGRAIAAPLMPPVAEQVEEITAGSTQTNGLNSKTEFVRLHAKAACHVAFGTNPTATTDSLPLAEGQTEYFNVLPDQRVAVIAGA